MGTNPPTRPTAEHNTSLNTPCLYLQQRSPKKSAVRKPHESETHLSPGEGGNSLSGSEGQGLPGALHVTAACC